MCADVGLARWAAAGRPCRAMNCPANNSHSEARENRPVVLVEDPIDDVAVFTEKCRREIICRILPNFCFPSEGLSSLGMGPASYHCYWSIRQFRYLCWL